MPSFATIQNGQLVGASDITFVRGKVVRRHQAVNTTNQGSGTSYRSTLGRFIFQLIARGFWDTGTNTYPLPIGTPSANGPIGRLSSIRLLKEQRTFNATAAPDGVDDMVFSKGVIRYSGTGTGYMQASEAPLGTESTQSIAQAEFSGFKIPLDDTHDVTANAVVRNIGENLRYDVGGAVLVDFEFDLIDSVTLNGTDNPFNQTEFDATLEADNSDQWSGTVILQQMEVEIDYENGGPTPIQVAGPFSGEPAVTITAV